MEDIPSSFLCELTLTDARWLSQLCTLSYSSCPETTSGSCPGLHVLPDSTHRLAEHLSGMKSMDWGRDFPRVPAQSRTKSNRYKPHI